MRPVDLNFAGTPFRNNTPYYAGYALGALVVAAFTVYNGWAYVHYSRSNDTLGAAYAANRAKLESLRKDATDLQGKIDKIDLGSMNARAAFTNGLLDRRRFSWTELLNNLEEVQVYQVRLLSLIPRIQDKGIVVDARAVAHDLKAMWNFEQNIQIHPKFRRVYPGGWTKSNEQGEIVFNLAFNYFPQGAPEGAQGPTPQEAGFPEFVEAPGPSTGPSEDAENTDDRPAEEPPPPASKKPSRAATTPPAGAGMVAPPGRAGAPPPPPSARTAADAQAKGTRKDSIPGMVAMDSASAARDQAAPAAANTTGTGRPSLSSFPTVTTPTGATGASGTSGPAGASGPGRHLGRGLPPGSHGVRPAPPPKPDVPMVPVNPPPKDDDPGDDQ